MRTVNIISTKGGIKQVETNASVWSQLVEELLAKGLDVSGLKAIVGETKHTLESGEAQLPSGNFSLWLSPINIKAGASEDNQYDFEYELEDVEDLSYLELRTELKSIRVQATELEDENVLSIIGNYTNDKVEKMKEKLTEVYQLFEEIEKEVAEEVSVNLESIPNLEERLLEIEFQLGIINDQNKEYINARHQEAMVAVLNGLI